MKNVYEKFLTAKQNQQKLLALLLDPDIAEERLERICAVAQHSAIDLCFVGGSLLHGGLVEKCIQIARKYLTQPIVLFPGNEIQLSNHADALLFLSLISGRNADLLIGKQVVAAPFLPDSGLEVISCGYMLVDGGKATTASYISQTMPIPADKPEIAVATGLAGYYLGHKLMYLDAGSGALHPVSDKMIFSVASTIPLPLIVGGGMRTPEAVHAAWSAGADVVVLGNSIEENPALLQKIRP